MDNFKHWLNELDSFDKDSGYLEYEESEELFVSIMEGLIKSVDRSSNKVLYDLVEELIDVYENSGYYDFGGEQEKVELREKISKLID